MEQTKSHSTRNLNILVIMLNWYPYEGPLMPIYGTIFKDLMDKGHKITIVCSFPHFRKGRSKTWDEYRGKLFEVTQWEKAKLIRSYVFAPVFDQDKPGLVYRALNFISFNISCMISAIFAGGKADILFAPSSPPLTNAMCAWIVSLFKRCPVVYNVQDMYPDMAIKMGILKNRYIARLLIILEKISYRLSDKILTVSGSMSDMVKKKVRLPQKVTCIGNFIDTDFIKPGPKTNEFSKKFGLDGRFVVMYAGNIGIPHGVEVLLDTAELMRNESDIFFCFVGRGENRDNVRRQTKERSLSNTVFIPPQPEEVVPLIWASASLCMITYKKGLAEMSVPSKLLAMMCAARPVIGSLDENSEAARIIKEAGCGIVVPPENEKEIVAAIYELKGKTHLAERMGRHGREYAVNHFRRHAISRQYERLFRSVARA